MERPMPFGFRLLRVVLSAVVASTVLSFHAGATPVSGTPSRPLLRAVTRVCLVTEGDDRISQRFEQAFDLALAGESDLARADCGSGSTSLVVAIPELALTQVGGDRSLVLYAAEIAIRGGRVLWSGRGSCWEDELGTCAGEVVREASKAADRVEP